ncbi:MAG: hypothetical protein EOO38_30255 [Cytophagaceae bacterium]|nr:MAG: hypothetical protein EOO38_30255 [Cytophagaceae bacterium]
MKINCKMKKDEFLQLSGSWLQAGRNSGVLSLKTTMQKLFRQGFADEVNRRVRTHPSYQQGNRICLYRQGTSKDARETYAYDYWGTCAPKEQQQMFTEVLAQVRAEFGVED